MKKCSKCGETKPWGAFHRDLRPGKGYQSRCRNCRSRAARVSAPGHQADGRFEGKGRLHIVPCFHCQSPVRRYASDLAKRKAIYCSVACKQAARPVAQQTYIKSLKGAPGRHRSQEERQQQSRALLARYDSPAGQQWKDALSQQMTGQRNHRWRDGARAGEYGRGFTERLKQAIMKRDEFKCVNCGEPKGNRPRSHEVHHLDQTKTNHNPDNLVTLCVLCHHRIHPRTKRTP